MNCLLFSYTPPPVVESSSNDQASSSEASEPPAKKAKGLTAVLNHILPKLQPNQMETASVDQHCKRGTQSYIEQPLIDSDYNPLDWWREQRKFFHSYPN